MLKIGIVGIGFMGWIHWLAYNRVDGVEVQAICAPEPEKRAGDWTSIQGNFGPPGEKVDLTGIGVYEHARDLFQDPDVELVDICLPPALHREFTVAALEAGKHVFCEKPMALNLADCQAMMAAADRSQRQLLIGHVLPFFPEFAHARQLIDSGQYGRLLGGHFKRVISDPTWIENFYDPQQIGGPLLDLHVHDAHFIRMLFGMPSRVRSLGRRRGDVVEFCCSLFEFDQQPLTVSGQSGVINQQGRPFNHGFEIWLEQATLQFEFAACADQADALALRIYEPDGTVTRPALPSGDPVDAFVAEIGEVVQTVSSGNQSEILDGRLAMDAIKICEMLDQAVPC